MDEVLKKVKKQLSACEPDFAQFIGRLLSSFPEGDKEYNYCCYCKYNDRR